MRMEEAGYVALAIVALLVVVGFTASGMQDGQAPTDPEVIYVNGHVITLAADSRVAEAVAVRDGRFLAVGSTESIRELAGRGTRVVNLEGHTVVPGFQDCHTHLFQQNFQRASWPANVHDLRHFADVDILLDTLRMIAAVTPPGEWIHGVLSETGFPDQRLPDRWTLDQATPNNPLALPRGPHTWTVNSRALELAGITGDTPNPSGGVIERDEAGEPTGHLREGSAQRLVGRLLPPEEEPTEDEMRQDLYDQLRFLVSLGITGGNIAGFRPGSQMRWIQDVYEEAGHELPRLTLQLRIRPGYDAHEDVAEAVRQAKEEVDGLSVRTGFGDDRLRIGAIKMSVDGGFTGRAAHLLEPYPDGSHGAVRIPEEALYETGLWAHNEGWQLGIHVIGDAGVRMVVDVLDRIVREGEARDHRHYMHHVSVLPPDQTVRSMADNNISVCSQPNFAYDLAPFYDQALSGERLLRNNPQRSLSEGGVRVAHGSDHRPYGPMVAVWAARWREGRDGVDYGRDLESISVEEALRSHTLNSAYINFNDDRLGSIEVGKLADMVVLTDDPLTHDPATLHHIGVLKTVVGGEVVYEASGRPRVARFDDGEVWYVDGESHGGPGSFHE